MYIGTDVEFGYFFGMFSAPIVEDSRGKNIFGNDHLGRIAEIRPKPVEIDKDFKFKSGTLETQLLDIYKKNPKIEFQLVTNHHTMPCGCHIHYDDSNDEKTIKIYTKINEIIIDQLGKLNTSIRKTTNFFKPTAIRKKSYGLEIMTLPSTILFHPGLLDILSILIIKSRKTRNLNGFYKAVKKISGMLGNTDYVNKWPLPAYFSKGGIYVMELDNNYKINVKKIMDSSISVLIGKKLVTNVKNLELVVNNVEEALSINKEFNKFVSKKQINFYKI